MPHRTPIYDAHHHLWDLKRCHYPWLEARGVKRFFGDPTPIQRNYLAEDLLEDAKAYELVGSTHVQVGTVEQDALAETRFVQDVADSSTNIGNAIIAYVDLTRPDLEEELQRHRRSPNFRGVRQIIARHPGEDAQAGTGQLVFNPAFARGLRALPDMGLSFDLQLIEQSYVDAADLFAEIPNLTFAICHFGSPWDLSRDGLERWREAMTRFAAIPGAHMKFSGFGMFTPDWSVEDIRPYVEAALELFGEARCFAGSNFPVDKLYGGYDRIWSALVEIVGRGSTYRKLTLENGQLFYRACPANSQNSSYSRAAPSSRNM